MKLPGAGAPSTTQQHPEGVNPQQKGAHNLNSGSHPEGSDEDARMDTPIAPSVGQSRRSRSSKKRSRALRASLELQQLEEQKQAEMEFIAKKFEILQVQLENNDDSSHSSKTRKSSHGSSQKTHN